MGEVALDCWEGNVDGSIVRVEEAADSCDGCCGGDKICCLSNGGGGGSMIEAAGSMTMWSMSTRPMRSARTWTARIESLIGGRMTNLSTRSLDLMAAVSIGLCSYALSCIRLACRRDVCASLAPLLRGGLLVCYCYCYCCYCCCHSMIRFDFIVLGLCLLNVEK